MGLPALSDREPPWVVVTKGDDPWVAAELAAFRERGGLEVRLNAAELLEPAELFRTFARELRFPSYFGHNWDALVDSLSDLHLDDDGIAVLIDDADLLLGADHLGLFVAVLCQAAWRAYVDPGFAMHFVLLLDETSPEEFQAQIGSRDDVTTEMVNGRLTAA